MFLFTKIAVCYNCTPIKTIQAARLEQPLNKNRIRKIP